MIERFSYTQYVLISKGPISKTSQISGFFKQWLSSEVFQVKQQLILLQIFKQSTSQLFQVKQK